MCSRGRRAPDEDQSSFERRVAVARCTVCQALDSVLESMVGIGGARSLQTETVTRMREALESLEVTQQRELYDAPDAATAQTGGTHQLELVFIAQVSVHGRRSGRV